MYFWQGTLVYWHCISGPVLFVNILFFSSFVKDLCFGIWSDTTAAKASTRQKRNNFKTTVKMFFTLGIPYICDLVAWSLLWAYGRTSLTIFTITSVLKTINASQGFIMFCVIFFDSSKIRTFYNKTMSYTTRSTFIVSEKKKEVPLKASNEKRTTPRMETVQELNIDNNSIDKDTQNGGNSESIIESRQEVCFEMTNLK